MDLAYVYQTEDKYTEAEKYFEKALAVWTARGKPELMARCLQNIGWVHVRKHNYAQADQYLQRSMQVRSGAVARWLE